eukprot:1757701-Rhodomonas_salina.2
MVWRQGAKEAAAVETAAIKQLVPHEIPAVDPYVMLMQLCGAWDVCNCETACEMRASRNVVTAVCLRCGLAVRDVGAAHNRGYVSSTRSLVT